MILQRPLDARSHTGRLWPGMTKHASAPIQPARTGVKAEAWHPENLDPRVREDDKDKG